jgi:hypothetical protein
MGKTRGYEYLQTAEFLTGLIYLTLRWMNVTPDNYISCIESLRVCKAMRPGGYLRWIYITVLRHTRAH